MPAVNPINAFNVGRDYSFKFVVNGQTFALAGSLITDVNRKMQSHLHEVIPLNNNGIPVFRVTFSGYEYEVHITRQNGAMDQLFDALMNNYYNGSVPPTVTCQETVRNPDQSVDQYMLLNGAIVPESMGSFKGADPVNDVTLRLRFGQRLSQNGAASAVTSLAQATSFL
jgi:hypothetical protein